MKILRHLFVSAAFTLIFTAAASAAPLEYYLPQGGNYDATVPKPSDVLGAEVGDWHLRHGQILNYLTRLAETSDRVMMEETGRSHENRPITLLTISSPANLARIDALRDAHRNLTREAPASTEDMPAVIWLGYSIHGNEPSGANASVLVAYHLAAGLDAEVTELLDECVILIDPSLNPDGLDRFAHWTNMHRGMNPVADPETREHNEAWPSGRTNHYWFDLNRDWLLLTHPESRARIKTFHAWKPDIFCDFHEMGTNATYFFQPGVPSRTNPLTPQVNQDLTARIADYHARTLDDAGSLYYSGERFDDFYYGKGSTYPDVNGCVGILFEQASSRGRRQESIQGTVEFPFTIRNQVLTSLSSMQAGRELREDLLEYKVDFYAESRRRGAARGASGLVFGDAEDPVRTDAMAAILAAHDIEVYSLNRDVRTGGEDFRENHAYVVPYNQAQLRLIESLFEKRTTFTDSLFYDVSTWNLPLSMNMPYAEYGSAGNVQGEAFAPAGAAPSLSLGDAVVYAIPWEGYLAPKAAHELLEAGLHVRAATRAMTFPEGVTLQPGAMLIPVRLQSMSSGLVADLVAQIARENRLPVIPLDTGLTPAGPDLGSGDTPPLKPVSVAVAVGSGVSSYWAGEVWHLLDHRMAIPTSHLEKDRISARRLDRYTHLILPHGSYGDLSEGQVEAIQDWVSGGGVLMALGAAVSWVDRAELTSVDFKDDAEEDSEAENEEEERAEKRPYAMASPDRGSRVTGGAILRARLDLTHPLAFGYSRDTLPVFRSHNRLLEPSRSPYATVAWYEADPLESGYMSADNLEQVPGTASVIAQRRGRGAVLLYNDNPNFRGVWYGTSKLFLNGLFFGPHIDFTGE